METIERGMDGSVRESWKKICIVPLCNRFHTVKLGVFFAGAIERSLLQETFSNMFGVSKSKCAKSPRF